MDMMASDKVVGVIQGFQDEVGPLPLRPNGLDFIARCLRILDPHPTPKLLSSQGGLIYQAREQLYKVLSLPFVVYAHRRVLS